MKKLPVLAALAVSGAIATFSATNVLAQADAAAAAVDPAVMAAGQPLYQRNCQACHGDQGQGGAGERLVGSPIVGTVGGIINQILVGSVEHGMPPFDRLPDDEIAAIATFVRNSWGNAFGPITPDQVAAARGTVGGE
ncbi:MAG: cytochrome c [Bauldia sp.]